MRLDIPLVVERIEEEGLLDLSNVTMEYALYTDTDVLFLGGDRGGGLDASKRTIAQQGQRGQQAQQQVALREQRQQAAGAAGGSSGGGGGRGPPVSDLSTCTIPAPRLLMLGREKARGVPWDTGVMLVNVPALRRAVPSLVKFGKQAGFDFPGWEQGGCGGGWVGMGAGRGWGRKARGRE
jgi:hypothetical protein